MSVFTNPSTRAGDDAAAYVTAVLGLVGDRDPIEILRGTPEALRIAIIGLSRDKLRQPEHDGAEHREAKRWLAAAGLPSDLEPRAPTPVTAAKSDAVPAAPERIVGGRLTGRLDCLG